MTAATQEPYSTRAPNQPTWEVAHLFPPQGTWTYGDYLTLKTNRLVELSEGYLEVLPMPTQAHQLIVMYLCRALYDFVAGGRRGMVLVAPLPIRLWEDKFRQPDIVFMLTEHAARRNNEFWDGADLVMEVISPNDPRRDVEIKRVEYARAGIPEYWIVDPRDKTVTVLVLDADRYSVHCQSGPDGSATSSLLVGFTVNVGALFASAEKD